MLSHVLTAKELDFVIELLTAESAKVLRFTRHDDSHESRENAAERMRTCDRLAERFREFKEGLLTP